MSMILKIIAEDVQNKAVLRLSGRIDTPNAPILEKKMHALIESGQKVVLLDMSGVDYLSSAGLRIFLSATKELKTRGGHFGLFNVQEDVMEIIKMAGFNKIIKLFDDEKQALQ